MNSTTRRRWRRRSSIDGGFWGKNGMQRRKVLVADDDRDIVLALRIRLEAAGYEVVTALDGKEAIDGIRTEKPDLAILDINMPEFTGFAVVDELKSAGGGALPVIFLTADTQEKSQVKAFHRGIRHYLTKPYDPQTLLVLVEHTLAEAGKGAA
ncbi:MAG: response regulator [Candidatus Eisenbacteria bacterium]|nr:response regulator [Candidatus Latescibacterota bacterium]MBD3303467.1 response regulator [Candidatus Eisenbacteria bacterium]